MNLYTVKYTSIQDTNCTKVYKCTLVVHVYQTYRKYKKCVKFTLIKQSGFHNLICQQSGKQQSVKRKSGAKQIRKMLRVASGRRAAFERAMRKLSPLQQESDFGETWRERYAREREGSERASGKAASSEQRASERTKSAK